MVKLWPVTATSHEDLFIGRYDKMLRWSLKLAGHDRQLAEDLVHDVYVHFVLVRPDIGGIQNLDGYLYVMLRNRHLSYVRRTSNGPVDHLQSIDYDSARFVFAAADPRARINSQDELRSICAFACLRKESSKSGSVFILRFFQDYTPAEIAKVIKAKRQAVDIWLRIARTEARRFLEDPAELTFIKGPVSRSAPNVYTATPPDDFLASLRLQVLMSRSGDCLSEDELELLYSPSNSAAVESKTLAHLVACPTCLTTAARMAGVPPPSDWSTTDFTGRDSGGRGPGAGGNAGNQQCIERGRRKAAAVFDHSPQKLCVSVNGFFIGSQNVTSETSELTLTISIDERVGFAEVTSEQGVLLLAMNVEPPPDGEAEQSTLARLSDGRTIEAAITFSSSWPKLRVVYKDPLYQPAPLADCLSEPVTWPVEAPPALIRRPTRQAKQETIEAPGLLRRLLRDLADPRFWLRPGSITAAVAVIVATVTLLFRVLPPSVSAAELLERAAGSERSAAASTDLAIHRIFSLEERSNGIVRSRRNIEVWQSGTPVNGVIRVRRLYEEGGRLLAGEWTNADGSATVYPRSRIDDSGLSGNEWRLEPSAERFSALIGDPRGARVELRPLAYTIVHSFASPGNEDGLLAARLTLAKADLRATEQVLLLLRGQEEIEYRFVETSFEPGPIRSVPAAVFERDPELLGPTAVRKSSPGENAAITADQRNIAGPAATAELEVDVTYLLNTAGANVGDQIRLIRSTDGKLVVRGVVETESRKAEILSALNSVLSNPAVRVEVATPADASRHGIKGPVSTDHIGVEEASTAAADSELRDYLVKQGVPSSRVDEEARHFSTRIVSVSRDALRHGWALRKLADQFKPDEAQGLSAKAQAKRMAMIREHAAAVQQQTETLRRELMRVFGENVLSSPTADDTPIRDHSELIRAIKRLAEMAQANDEDVRSAFTVSAGGSRGVMKSTRFWESLRKTEELARRAQAGSTAIGGAQPPH